MAILIGGGLFVSLYALLWLNVQEWEAERERAAALGAEVQGRRGAAG